MEMSDYHIRTLAAACAPRIAAQVETVVLETVRRELPGVLADVLREQFPGETLHLYIPKRSVHDRKRRDMAICREHNGHNTRELSKQYGLTPQQINNIVRAGKISL